MTIWLAFVALILACMAFGYLVRMLQDRARQERREYADEIEYYQERGRHAASKPRQRPNTALVKPREPKTVLPWYAPSAGIAPVIVPDPKRHRPQAGRDSGAGTGTMDRLTTTGELAFGELRANAFIASLVADEEAHRLESAT